MAFAFDPSYRARLLALPRLLQQGRGPGSGLRARLRGGRIEFQDHRSYVPGDDPRDIDWSLFLRLEVLAVKEFSREEAPAVAVILDRSGSMGREGGGKDRIQREVAGGLVHTALRAGAPVSLAVLDEAGPRVLSRFRSAREVDAILSVLEEMDPPTGPTWLHRVVRLPPARGAGRVVFLLSDFLVDPPPADSLPVLARGSGTGFLLHLVAEEERHPRFGETAVLRDPETGETLLLPDTQALLPHYREELARHEEEILRLARGHGLGHALVDDRRPFETTILHLLRGGRA